MIDFFRVNIIAASIKLQSFKFFLMDKSHRLRLQQARKKSMLTIMKFWIKKKRCEYVWKKDEKKTTIITETVATAATAQQQWQQVNIWNVQDQKCCDYETCDTIHGVQWIV